MKKRTPLALKISPLKITEAVTASSPGFLGAVGKSLTTLAASPYFAPIAVGYFAYSLMDMYGSQRKFRDDIREAEGRLDRFKTDFENLSTRNLYENVENPYADIQTQFENVYEDMIGVDTTATDIATKEFQQNLATTLDRMQQLGIVNAQQLANASMKQSENTRAALAQQVRQADMLRAQGAANVQKMEQQAEFQQAQGAFAAEQMRLQGAVDARSLQYQKTQGLMALEAGELDSLRAAKQADRNFFEKLFGIN